MRSKGRVSVCRDKNGEGCGQEIRWGRLFGKAHPFNLDGTSHFDSCPEADKFRRGRGGLRLRGDLDTFYREQWREAHYSEDREFDAARVHPGEVPSAVSLSLAQALNAVGGPLYHAGYPDGFIQQGFWGAGFDRKGKVYAVLADNLILFRLRDYFHEVSIRPYRVGGVFIIGG